MPMKFVNSIFPLFFLLVTACSSQSQTLTVYEKGKVYPKVAGAPGDVKYFTALFADATGEALQEPTADALTIVLKVSERGIGSTGNFSLKQNKNELVITGRTQRALEDGIAAFFTQYGGLAAKGFRPAPLKMEIPAALDYSEHYDFEYREPYFAQAMDADFAKWNKTQRLDDTWAIWGHSIGKKIKVTPAMLAIVDGEPNEDQFCFSSPELESALKGFINKSLTDNPKLNHFMIAPNDNDLACLCDKCKAAGNKPGDASPAVFSLLNRLAQQFSKQQFFSVGYLSTKSAPPFKLKSNAGVIVSTIAFPKGVVLENSNKKEVVESTLKSWKSVSEKVYLWDYGLNFDNFNEFYPALMIAQQNLKFYKANGVTGVFINGNETGMAAFGGLKAFIYAQLLRDTNIDIQQYIGNYIAGKYPSCAKYLTDYYISLEEAAFNSPKQLPIYGGMMPALKKYFDEKAFNDLYPVLLEKYGQAMPEAEREAFRELLLSFTFQKLEVMRVKGVRANGYATQSGTTPAVINADVPALVERLGELKTKANQPYNETGYKIADYCDYWKSEIINRPYQNLLLGKKLQLLSVPDEDYPDIRMLTDGAVGFYDYYNNWMLTTTEPLSVRISAEDAKGAKVLEMGFLHDPKHRIFAPKSVKIGINGTEATYDVSAPLDGFAKARVSIPISTTAVLSPITITLVKQPEYQQRSVACDEIVLK